MTVKTSVEASTAAANQNDPATNQTRVCTRTMNTAGQRAIMRRRMMMREATDQMWVVQPQEQEATGLTEEVEVQGRRRAAHAQKQEVGIQLPAHLIQLPAHLFQLPAHLFQLPAHLFQLPAHLIQLPAHLIQLLAHLIQIPGHLFQLPAHLIQLPAHLIQLPAHPIQIPAHLIQIPAHLIQTERGQGKMSILEMRSGVEKVTNQRMRTNSRTQMMRGIILTMKGRNKNQVRHIGMLYVTLDHKSLKSLGYIGSNSQKYIVWVIIHFSLMAKIIRLL